MILESLEDRWLPSATTATTLLEGTGPVTTQVFSGFSFSGGGAPYSGPVGTLSSNNVLFGTQNGWFNWHPFGLDQFGADIKGHLNVSATGTYSFNLTSDDGSLLFIDGQLVIDDGSTHGPNTVVNSAFLTTGIHTFEIQFFECCGGASGVDLFLPNGVSYWDGSPTLLEGFEGVGVPAGWTLSDGGVGGVSAAASNISPTQGSQFGYIDNTGSTSMDFTGVSHATTGTYLISAPFTVPGGVTLSFDANFFTNDGNGYNDFAYVDLLQNGSTVATLFNANTSTADAQAVPAVDGPQTNGHAISSGVTLSPSTAFFDGLETGPIGDQTYGPTKYGGGNGGSTGWITSSFTPGAGTYQLEFVVSNLVDSSVSSGLAFDNILLSTSNTDAPLTAGALTPPQAVEGQSFANLPVFHFTDADSNATASDYTAVVSLGDGNSVTLTSTPSNQGQIVANANGGFDVQLSYTYAEELSNQTFGVTVTDAGGASTSASTTVTVCDPAVQAQAASPANAVEGTSTGNISLATFTDPGNPGAAAEPAPAYSATINWGDGSPDQPDVTEGTISGPDANGQYTVTGEHTYGRPGLFTVTTTIDHEGILTKAETTIQVANVTPTVNPLAILVNNAVPKEYTGTLTDRGVLIGQGQGITIGAGDSVSGSGTFVDPGFQETWTGTVNFGDGSAGANQSLTINNQGFVIPAHVYATAGTYVVTVTINDGTANGIPLTMVVNVLSAQQASDAQNTAVTIIQPPSTPGQTTQQNLPPVSDSQGNSVSADITVPYIPPQGTTPPPPPTLSLTSYSGNPNTPPSGNSQGEISIGAGSSAAPVAFFDVKTSNIPAGVGASLVITYDITVARPEMNNITVCFLSASGWQVIASDHVKITFPGDDGVSPTVKAVIQVTIDDTTTPSISDLTGTVFTVALPTPPPAPTVAAVSPFTAFVNMGAVSTTAPSGLNLLPVYTGATFSSNSQATLVLSVSQTSQLSSSLTRVSTSREEREIADGSLREALNIDWLLQMMDNGGERNEIRPAGLQNPPPPSPPRPAGQAAPQRPQTNQQGQTPQSQNTPQTSPPPSATPMLEQEESALDWELSLPSPVPNSRAFDFLFATSAADASFLAEEDNQWLLEPVRQNEPVKGQAALAVALFLGLGSFGRAPEKNRRRLRAGPGLAERAGTDEDAGQK